MKEFGNLFSLIRTKIDGFIESEKQREIQRYQSPLVAVFSQVGLPLPEDDAAYHWARSSSMSDVVGILRVVQLLKEGDEAARALDEDVPERARIASAYLLSLPTYQPTYWKRALFSLEANGWDIETARLNPSRTPSQYESESIGELQDSLLSVGKDVLDQVGVSDADSLYDLFANSQKDVIGDDTVKKILEFAFELGFDAPPAGQYVAIAGQSYSLEELHDKGEALLRELGKKRSDQGEK